VADRMLEVLEQGSNQMGPIGHGWTYSAHPICTAAGVANLELVDRENMVQNAGEVGGYLNSRLRETFADHEMVGDVRGEGMLAALEFVAQREGRKFFSPEQKVGARVSAACLERGLVARAMPQGDILGMAPPLCLTREEADIIVSTAKEAVDVVAKELI